MRGRQTIREPRSWSGRIRIVRTLPDGSTEISEFENLITDAGKDLLVSALAGGDSEITYVGWGDDNTAPAASDTTLGNELGRKAVTQQTAGAAGSGEYDTIVYLGPNDANGTIEELGWFAGPTASATVDTGVMVARVLYSTTKSDDESIQVDRTDTIS